MYLVADWHVVQVAQSNAILSLEDDILIFIGKAYWYRDVEMLVDLLPVEISRQLHIASLLCGIAVGIIIDYISGIQLVVETRHSVILEFG